MKHLFVVGEMAAIFLKILRDERALRQSIPGAFLFGMKFWKSDWNRTFGNAGCIRFRGTPGRLLGQDLRRGGQLEVGRAGGALTGQGS